MVCLQGICGFIVEAIKIMTSWVKIHLSWIIVCPIEGIGGFPLKKIGEQSIILKILVQSKVVGIPKGQWMVGILIDKCMGWEHDQKLGVRRTLKHILGTTEGKRGH